MQITEFETVVACDLDALEGAVTGGRACEKDWGIRRQEEIKGFAHDWSRSRDPAETAGFGSIAPSYKARRGSVAEGWP